MEFHEQAQLFILFHPVLTGDGHWMDTMINIFFLTENRGIFVFNNGADAEGAQGFVMGYRGLSYPLEG